MSLSQSEVRAIASRYVSALFPLAEESGTLDAVAREFAALSSAVSESAALRNIISSPAISRSDKAQALDALLIQSKASDLTRRTVTRLAKNNRLSCISEIAVQFQDRLAKLRGEVTVDIISAQALSKDQSASIVSTLEKAAGKKIAAKYQIKPEILGGVMIRQGSLLLDYSLKGKLQRLGETLKSPAA